MAAKTSEVIKRKEPLVSEDLLLSIIFPAKGNKHTEDQEWEIARAVTITGSYEMMDISPTKRIWFSSKENMLYSTSTYTVKIRLPNPMVYTLSLNKLEAVLQHLSKACKSNYMYVVHPTGVVEKLCATS